MDEPTECVQLEFLLRQTKHRQQLQWCLAGRFGYPLGSRGSSLPALPDDGQLHGATDTETRLYAQLNAR